MTTTLSKLLLPCAYDAMHICQPLAVPDREKVEIHPNDGGGGIQLLDFYELYNNTKTVK